MVDALVDLHGYTEDTEEGRELLYQEARRIVVAEYQVRMGWFKTNNYTCPIRKPISKGVKFTSWYIKYFM